MNRWKIHHEWSKELSLVLPQPQLQSSSQVKVPKKGNETHGIMREVSRDVLYVTEVPFWCRQCRCCERLCSPSTSAPCNTHPAASYQVGALFRKSHSTSLNARCLYTRTSNWKLFRHLKCHQDLRNPVFRVTHSCPKTSLGSPVTLCSLPLSALQIPGAAVPCSFTELTWQKPPVVQPTRERPVCGSALRTHRTEPWWAVWRQVAGLEPAAVLGIN